MTAPMPAPTDAKTGLPVIYPTRRKAVNAARRAFGACRYGDIAGVFRTIPGHSARHAKCEGYTVCPRVDPADVAGVHKAMGFLPQEEAVLVAIYHDTLKG